MIQYLQSVRQAFGDVSDDLLSYQKYRENDVANAAYAAAAIDSVRLANLRFEGGVTSYLEVLQAQTASYGAQVSLAQAELNERLALVQLYKATGGGWQSEPQAPTVQASATPRPALPPGVTLTPQPVFPGPIPRPTPTP